MKGSLRGPAAATLIALDCEGHITSWPDAAREMFGRTAAQTLGQPFTSIVDDRQRCACANVVTHLCRTVAPGSVHTMELLASRLDGATFHVECSMWRATPLAGTDRTGFDVLVRDISDRVRVEDDLREQLRELRQFSIGQLHELRRTQSRFMDIVETIDEVFWMANAEITRMLYISPGYERVWGRSCQSLYDDPRSFIDAMHPDDRDRVAADLLVKRGLPFDHEYRIIRPDGTSAWIWDRGFPVCNPDGTIDRYIGVAQDITSRKGAETALRRQETLDAIGHMTGGLAHDFNNILGVVVGHLDLIGLSMPHDAPERESLNRALDASLRGTRLAKRLLSLARREPVERRTIALGDAVQALRPLLQHAAGSETVLVLSADANPLVSVDPGELDAALINLAVNARAAMPGGGRLTVIVDEAVLGADASDYSLEPGRYASLAVEDTGCGMSEEVLRRLGEPFFTTRQDRDGTGLGVSMIHAFVRQSHGVMRVQSEPGVGSRFRILLPVVVRSQSSSRVHEGDAPTTGSPQRRADVAPSPLS